MNSARSKLTSIEEALKKSFPGLSISFVVDPTETQAFISIDRYPEQFTEQNLINAVVNAIKEVFTYGIDTHFISETLPQIIIYRKCVKNLSIAAGTKPIQGEPAEIELFVSRPSKEYLVLSDGSIDFKTRDLFKCVTQGEKLAEKTPPTEGTHGISVFGEPIPPIKGADKRLAAGRNTVCRVENGKETVYAASEGQVNIETALNTITVNVLPEMRINGDIDYNTGNINFKGSLIVAGSILNGFSVNVTGNLQVNGMIEPGTSVIVGGDLNVRKGILGAAFEADPSKGIRVFGNLVALYAENAALTVDGEVYLRSALNCNIMANGGIFIEKSLIGGSITCLRSVVAGSIGNASGLPTKIHCGIAPSLYNKLNLILKIIADLSKQRENTEKNLSFVTSFPEKIPAEKYTALKESLKKQLINLENQITKLELKKADLVLLLLKENQATISAQTFFPGTILSIRNSSVNIDIEQTNKTFFQKMPEEIIEATYYQPGRSKAQKPKS